MDIMKKHIYISFLIVISVFSWIQGATLNSQICTIDSKVDNIIDTTQSIESIICTIEASVTTIESHVDIIDQDNNNSFETTCTIESLVDVLDVQITSIDSKIDDIDNLYLTVASHLEMIGSFVETTVCSKITVIDSLVDSAILRSNTIESSLDTADRLMSSIDYVLSGSSTLEATWCTLDSNIDATESIIDLALGYINTIESTVISIESQVDTAILQSQTIESVVDIINQQLFTDVSLADFVESKICDIESKIELLDTTIQEVNMLLGQANDTSDDISIDFQETWTILQALRNSLITIQSNTDVVCDDINAIEFIFDQTEVFTAIKYVENTACTVENGIDALQRNINEIQDLAYYETYTALQAVIDKLVVSDSLIDEVKITATVIDSLQACIGTPITQADVGTTGFTISTAGRYHLAEDIEFNPVAAATAISITAAGSVLDLNGKTLRQGNTTAGVTAVAMSPFTNLENGNIQEFTNRAITMTSSTVVRDVRIEGRKFSPTVAGGGIFLFSLSSQTVIQNVVIANCPSEAIYYDFSGDGNLLNCSIINCGTGINFISRNSSGASPTQTYRYKFKDCKFIDIDGYGIRGDFRNSSGGFPSGKMVIDRCVFCRCGAGGIAFSTGSGTSRSFSGIVQNSVFLENGTYGLSSEFTSTGFFFNTVIRNNFFARNGISGIRTNKMANSVIMNNVFIENGTLNLNAIGAQTVLGNMAFHSSGDSSNYSAPGTTVVPKIIVSQTAAFPSPTPTFWYNISMTP